MCSSDLGARVAAFAGKRRALILLDPALDDAARREAIMDGLAAADFAASPFILPLGEPKEATAQAAVEHARTFDAGMIIAIGGGSTMDTGKLVASLVADHGGIAAYRLAAMPLPSDRLPLVCIPTTAGTGAEAKIGRAHV